VRGAHGCIEVGGQLSGRRVPCRGEGTHHDSARWFLLGKVRQPVTHDMAQPPAYLIANNGTADRLADNKTDPGLSGLVRGRDVDHDRRASGPRPGAEYVGELRATA
jgi:hypothetical protein